MPLHQSTGGGLVLPFTNVAQHNHINRSWNVRHHRGRRCKSRIMEQIDYFLEGMGLYRKQTARDATCLFRCVSEQLFYSQCFHYSVRLSCIHFMERNLHLFPEKIGGERFEEHSRRLRSPREWGGQWEMQAMALLYKRDFIVFNDVNTTPVQVTDNNFAEKILLCQIGHNHFDSVFPKRFIDNAAICQSLVYELLYGKVFGMEDIDTAVQVMLYESKASKDQSEIQLLLKDNCKPNSVINVLVKGGTPFPYKVAKSLDPRMYRNVEFDLWSDEKKETKRSNGIFHNEILQIGSKCLVTIDDDHQYPAYIQDMQPDRGPVNVFVEVLGRRCTVPYDRIEPMVLPVSISKSRCIYLNGSPPAGTNGSGTTVVQQALKFRSRVRSLTQSNRIATSPPEKSSDVSSLDKIHRRNHQSSNAAAAAAAIDLNNNNQLDNQTMVWRNSHNNRAATTIPAAETSVAPAEKSTLLDSNSPMTESPLMVDQLLAQQPFYVMSSPWNIPTAPPPAVPPPPFGPPSPAGYLAPPPPHLATPVYVTFADGTTMIVPAHARFSDAQQPAPWMFYDPGQLSVPPPFNPQYPMVSELEHPEGSSMANQPSPNLHRQQLVFHDSGNDRSGYVDGLGPPNLTQLQSLGYWTDPAQYQPANQHPTNGAGGSLINGEMAPVTLYFSPSYQPTFQVGT